MKKVNKVDYIFNNCVRIEKEKYNKIMRNYAVMDFILVLVSVFLILHIVAVVNVIKKNTELESKLQEYQDEVVYYRHTYEDEIEDEK